MHINIQTDRLRDSNITSTPPPPSPRPPKICRHTYATTVHGQDGLMTLRKPAQRHITKE